VKAESTIRKQMCRLWRLAQDNDAPEAIRDRCYDAYHALLWVVARPSWTPAGMAEEARKREEE